MRTLRGRLFVYLGAAVLVSTVLTVGVAALLASVGRSFNAMADQLAASRDAERAFLLSVSHELKTPLTAIRGYAEAIGDGAVGPEEAGAVIGEEADRLERLVRDVLDLARLDQPGDITVRDTGPGLDPEDLPRAFDRFHLHAKYGADRQLGSGLGLAIVRELARAMGGDATVASRRGEGAAFTVRLAG